MSKRSYVRVLRTVTPFFLLALLFLGGTYFVLLTTTDRVIQSDAALASSTVSTYLSSRPDEIKRLESGIGPSPSAVQFLRDQAAFANIVALSLVNGDGRTVYASSLRSSQNDLSSATSVISNFSIRSPNGKMDRLEVLSDQGSRWSALNGRLIWAVIALAFLTACSFGIPAIVFVREVAKRERGEERINFMAHHDGMTELLNRSAFRRAFDERLAIADGTLCAVHFIDVDRFKTINESLGHSVGDAVITSLATQLQTIGGPEDLLARFGGHEFVMAQFGVCDIEDAQNRAALIRHAIQEPLQAGKHQVRVTASVGSAVFPRDGQSSAELEKAADLALNYAKADGRDVCRLYDPRMDAALEQRRKIEKALLHAFSTNSFNLHFQPIVVADGAKLLGFEVLLRLATEEGEDVPPTDFIPVAEEMGLISQIGGWVIRKACQTAMKWPEHLTIAVNMSPRQFENDELCGVVEKALSDSGLAPERLELEITEGLLVSDTERVLSQLRRLKALGVSIAMDDFGTGYSSLSYLWQFPFDKLKIDRSFMSVIAKGDQQVSSILNTIISLGRTLNLQVTAEGVETREQAVLLQKLNCNQLQGYFFGRPTPEWDVPATIMTSVKGELAAALDKEKALERPVAQAS